MKALAIRKYLEKNYGECKHDTRQMEYACKVLSKELKTTPKSVFLFMVENEPIEGCHTHSYGFNTREGRGIKDYFQSLYNDLDLTKN